jgi:hypothetical protein
MLIYFNNVSALADSNLGTITISGKRVEAGDTFSVSVKLSNNQGIADLKLTLDYDSSVMTLIDVDEGSALSSLTYTDTNSTTSEGYAIIPFKLMWDGIDNDHSTGTLAILTFKIKDDAIAGNYEISFNYYEGDVAYFNNYDIIDGDVAINSGTIIISAEGYVIPEEEPPTAAIIIVSTAGGAGVIGTAVYFIVRAKRFKKVI